jgi:hypothetical protein
MGAPFGTESVPWNQSSHLFRPCSQKIDAERDLAKAEPDVGTCCNGGRWNLVAIDSNLVFDLPAIIPEHLQGIARTELADTDQLLGGAHEYPTCAASPCRLHAYGGSHIHSSKNHRPIAVDLSTPRGRINTACRSGCGDRGAVDTRAYG